MSSFFSMLQKLRANIQTSESLQVSRVGLRRAERGGLSKPSVHLHGLTNGLSAVSQTERVLAGGGSEGVQIFQNITNVFTRKGLLVLNVLFPMLLKRNNRR